MKTPLLLLAAAILLPWISSPVAAKGEVRVRALSFQSGFPQELFVHLPSGSKSLGLVQVKSFLNHEANELKHNGGELVFTRSSKATSATDVNRHVGKVEFPKGAKSVILLFLPEPRDGVEFASRVVVIADDARAFPPGSFRVANLASKTTKIELEKKPFLFEPGEIKTIAKPPYGANKRATMRAYSKDGDDWKTVSSGAWSSPGTRRILQLFIEDPVRKRVMLKSIRDVVVP